MANVGDRVFILTCGSDDGATTHGVFSSVALAKEFAEALSNSAHPGLWEETFGGWWSSPAEDGQVWVIEEWRVDHGD